MADTAAEPRRCRSAAANCYVDASPKVAWRQPNRRERAEIRAGERYALSAGQRRMWFLQAMDPSDVTLNICVSYRLTGVLDEARLRTAFDDVVARHAILRTVYGVDSEGEPYQVFSDGVQIGWRTDDVTPLPAAERQPRIEALAREEFGRPFDLTNEPPLRVTLIRSGTDDFVLLLAVHHIAWDDDSWDVFFGELSAAYNGDRPGTIAPQFVAVEVLETPAEPGIGDVGYWADVLRPSPEPLELPGFALGRLRIRPDGPSAELGRCPPTCSAGWKASRASRPPRRSWCCWRASVFWCAATRAQRISWFQCR